MLSLCKLKTLLLAILFKNMGAYPQQKARLDPELFTITTERESRKRVQKEKERKKEKERERERERSTFDGTVVAYHGCNG